MTAEAVALVAWMVGCVTLGAVVLTRGPQEGDSLASHVLFVLVFLVIAWVIVKSSGLL